MRTQPTFLAVSASALLLVPSARGARRTAIPTLFLLVVALATSSSAASISDADIQSQLEKHRAGKGLRRSSDHEHWSAAQLPEPIDLVRALPEPATVRSATLAFEDAYSLSNLAARQFLSFAVLAYDQDTWPPAREAEAVEACFAAAKAAPDALAPMVGLASLLTRLATTTEFQDRVFLELDAKKSPAGFAAKLLPALPNYSHWRPFLASYIVSRRPAALFATLQLLGTDNPYNGLFFQPFYLAAVRALKPQERSTDIGRALSRRVMRDLLQQGQPSIARELLNAMSETEQLELFTQERPPYATEGTLPSLIAAAYFEAADTRTARKWLDASPDAASSSYGHTWCDQSVTKRLLGQALDGPKENAFQTLVAARTCGAPSEYPWPAIQALVLAKVYPEHVREQFVWLLENGPQRHDTLLNRFPFTRSAAAELQRGDAHARKAAQEWLAAHASASENARPIQPSVAARQLAAPALNAFEERQLAEVPEPASNAGWRVLTEDASKLPPGFWFVRGEQKENETVVLALSQRVDPTGEVSGGGYWLLLSEDGGATWKAPLYTGLRALHPYELANKSARPILDGQVIRLEASRRELEDSLVLFPPVVIPTGPVSAGIILVSSLEALRRDSDGDGLSDLVEDRLLLDPLNPDSDGDGIPDQRDFVPNTPNRTSVPSRESELVAEVLFRLTQPGGRRRGFITGAGDGGDGMPEMFPAPESLDGVLFVETTAPVGTERGFPVRIIVLTPDEVAAARRRFGLFFPMRLKIFFNTAKDEALIDWDEAWRGGGGRAKWDGGWKLTLEEGWVT